MMLTPPLFYRTTRYADPDEYADSVQWDAAGFLSRTPAVVGNDKIFTVSFWFRAVAANEMRMFAVRDPAATSHVSIILSQSDKFFSVLRRADTNYSLQWAGNESEISSWSHIVVAVDTTQAVDTNRHKVWVNGKQITTFLAAAYPPLNAVLPVSQAFVHWIGKRNTEEQPGALALFYLLDGVAATAAAFGETVDGVWRPKPYTGAFGNEGVFLDFSDSAALGEDRSGNGNDFTPSGIVSTNYRADGPTKCTAWLNPVFTGNHAVLSKSNTWATVTSVAFETVRGNILIPPSGKWYWELLAVDVPDLTNVPRCGVIGEQEWSAELAISASEHGYCYRADGVAEHAGVSKLYGSPFILNDIIGVAFDAAAGSIEFYRNGVSQGVAYTGLEGWFYPAVSCGSSFRWQVNFGQYPFIATIPSGFRPVSAATLPFCDATAPGQACVSVVAAGADVEDDLAALRPSWAAYIDIFKNRSLAEDWEVRFSNDPEPSMHFNTTAGNGAPQTLAAGDTYVGISLAVSPETGIYSATVFHRAGFDTSIAHGLVSDTGRVAAIVKRSDSAGDWFVVHPDLTPGWGMRLNSDAAQGLAFDRLRVSGSEVTIDRSMPSGYYRAIVVAEKFGVSRLSSYVGNGAAMGPYLFGGVRPEVFMAKRVDAADDWVVSAWVSGGPNPVSTPSALNTNGTPLANRFLDFTSDGIMIHNAVADMNASGGVYLSIMFAGAPFGAINGRTTNGVF